MYLCRHVRVCVCVCLPQRITSLNWRANSAHIYTRSKCLITCVRTRARVFIFAKHFMWTRTHVRGGHDVIGGSWASAGPSRDTLCDGARSASDHVLCILQSDLLPIRYDAPLPPELLRREFGECRHTDTSLREHTRIINIPYTANMFMLLLLLRLVAPDTARKLVQHDTRPARPFACIYSCAFGAERSECTPRPDCVRERMCERSRVCGYRALSLTGCGSIVVVVVVGRVRNTHATARRKFRHAM